MYRYALAFVLIQVALAKRTFSSEDDLMSPDMSVVQTSDRQTHEFMQPNIVNVPSHLRGSRGNDDIDEGRRTESMRNFKKKKPRRTNLQRIKNHKARRGGPRSVSRSMESQIDDVKVVDLRSINWKPESQVLVNNCRAGINRPSWNETECISCKCRSNQVECQKPKCPELKCDNQIKVEGDCCPTCPEKLCETSDGRRFKHGDEWHMDDCTFCKCSKGKVECSVEDCQVPRCKHPIKVPGRCCPVCLDTSCNAANGTKITAEEVWREGVCTHCYCSGGEKKCDAERCPYVNCTARHTPTGRCCQRCNEGVVDCAVSEWGSWSECAVQECGGGMAKRFRVVVTPHKNGGNFCPHMSEARMCPRLPCDVLPVCPVTEWSHWGHCTATCGSGRMMRTRARARTSGAPMTSLIDCSTTHFEETKQCELGSCSAELVIDHMEALAHGDICYQVTWSEWSSCSSPDCGSGIQRRSQILINQSHPRGHLCHLLEEMRRCECDPSLMGNQVIRCQVSAWSPWTKCSKTCGPGAIRTKRRQVLQQPSGGAQCPRLTVSKPCRIKACSPRTASRTYDDVCVTDRGEMKSDGEKWTEGACASCRCDRSQIRCLNACKR